MMANYDVFAKFFDALMDKPTEKVRRIENYIRKMNPGAKSVLDVACGTGNVLNLLPSYLNKTGLDTSNEMLKIARKKVKKAIFFHQDMRLFQFNDKFDVIVCIYDSINHLVILNDWLTVFNKVSDHLTEDGIFIFDVQTEYRLQQLKKKSPWVTRFGKGNDNMVIWNVTNISNNCFNWQVEIFEHKNGNTFLRGEENIPEKVFSSQLITKNLKKYFQTVMVEDDEAKRVSKFSERIWFICKNSK
jgi:SAM-dependent methyltransferase